MSQDSPAAGDGTTAAPQDKYLGYSVMRTHKDGQLFVCLALPHIAEVQTLAMSGKGNVAHLTLGGVQVSLGSMPNDVVALLHSHPERILLVTVDSLSRVRCAQRASEISRAVVAGSAA